MRHHLRNRLAVLCVATVAVVSLGALTGCEPAPDTYVAIGDSSVAGPLIPNPSGMVGCLKSDHNYAHLVTPQIKVERLVDVSCSGATTWHMTHAQSLSTGESNPPQLDALDARTKLVTIGVGANDIGLAELAQSCLLANPFGPGCHVDYIQNGRDLISERIANTARAYASVLAEAKRRAPHATIFSVESPSAVPATGSGCYPILPLLPQDIDWARARFAEADQALAAVEREAGVVRVALPGAKDHHVCKPAGERWIEPLIPSVPVAPFHTNAAGHQAQATALAKAINARFPN